MQHSNVVPIRSRKSSKKGVSRVFWLLILSFLALLISTLYFISPYALVSEIEINGNNHLSSSEVLTATGIELGMHLWRFSPTKSADELASNPWVASAKVTRVLPNGLSISLLERNPAAIVSMGSDSWVVSCDGHILAENTGYPLPWLTGLEIEDAAVGGKLEGEAISLGLAWIEGFQVLGAHISEVNLDNFPSYITLYTTDGYKALFSKNTVPADRINDFIALLQSLRGQALRGTIDFRTGSGQGIFTPWPEEGNLE